MLNIGLANEIIMPPFGAGLIGCINPSPASVAFDDIRVRAIAIGRDGKYTGFLVFDLLHLGNSSSAKCDLNSRRRGSRGPTTSSGHPHTPCPGALAPEAACVPAAEKDLKTT